MKQILLLVFCTLLAASGVAQTTRAIDAKLTLGLSSEEGKKLLQAKLTSGGKPVEGASVEFLVSRQFGQLSLGKDQTLDDGTAAVDFPADLPGGKTGELQVTAVVQAPAELAGASAQGVFGGATVLQESPDVFPRALWAPRAPVLLIVSFTAILAVVWCSYAFVVRELWALSKGE